MEFKKNDFNGIYAEIFENIGEEMTRKIHNCFNGQQLNFPKKLYSKDYVIEYICQNYDGKNIRKLARELDYSERWIQALINKNKIGKIINDNKYQNNF